MSGGTPVGGGGYIRQRHSQGYASGDDDLEDDACSRSQPFALDSPRSKTWVEILENVFWIASAFFIVYFGDMHSNIDIHYLTRCLNQKVIYLLNISLFSLFFLEAFYGVYEKDPDKVIEAMVQMGVLVPTGDLTTVRRTALFFLNSFEERLAAQRKEKEELAAAEELGFKKPLSKRKRSNGWLQLEKTYYPLQLINLVSFLFFTPLV